VFYKSTSLGKALTKSLNAMVAAKELTLQQALGVQRSFDACVVPAMRETHTDAAREVVRDRVLSGRKRGRKGTMDHKVHGDLDNYNNFKDSWRIDVVNAEIRAGRSGSRVIRVPRARFLFSCSSRARDRRRHKAKGAGAAEGETEAAEGGEEEGKEEGGGVGGE